MKRIFLFILPLFLYFSVDSLCAQSRYDEIDITGVWESETFFDDDTEPSIDTFIILKFRDTYGIVCTSYPHFSVGEIERKDNVLTFTMLNSLSRDDIYILDYYCNIIDEDLIKCKFINQRNAEVNRITWRRLNIR